MNSDKFSIKDLKEIEKYSINRLTEYEIKNLNFIKVMFGNSSRAGDGFEYKIDEINETDNWHPETKDAKGIGGFNFSVEEKIRLNELNQRYQTTGKINNQQRNAHRYSNGMDR